MDDRAPAEAQLQQLLADEWEWRLQEDPLFATYAGDYRYNDRLPHVSETDQERRLAQLRQFQKRLTGLDRDALPAAEQLNYDIFARLLGNEVGEYEYRTYYLPISKSGGFHIYFPELYVFVPLQSAADYDNYIARLRAFRRYAAEHIDLMRAGLRQGFAPARVTLEGVLESIAPHANAAPEDSPLYLPFRQFPNGVPAVEQPRLAQAGRQAIAESVAPGYQDLLAFLRDEYLPGARESVAASELPAGRAFYQHRIRYYTSLELSPEAIHAIGLTEVERIRGEMGAVIARTGFEGSLREFIEFLRHDPRFYATTPEVLLQATAYVLKRMDGELPTLFGRLPRLPYGIRPIPDYSAPGNTTAYYQPGAGDGTRAGMYYVNTYDLPSRPLYEIEALSLHEAVPGHHLQIALQQELDLPPFRRFGGITAFTEGWALYAERLGLEAGFYTDPYSDFGRLSYEMWRACRLVVDTGLHVLGWSRQQAIDFMAENTSSTLLNITNEVDRYIAWPGQALAYKLGELKIRELRAQAEQALGHSFDRRAFHDLVLGSGAVPLDVLEAMVTAWIAARQPAPASVG